MELASGHRYEVLEDDLQQQYNKDFQGVWNDVVRLQPGGWILTKLYLKLQQKIYNFKFRPDDVLVMTYPKCGTTWTQEIVWTMRKNPNLDNPDVEDALFVRSPYIELDLLFPEDKLGIEKLSSFVDVFLRGIQKYGVEVLSNDAYMFQLAENHQGGRTLKTHLPLSLFPKTLLDTCKVVYVTRNVKDTIVSTLHHYRTHEQHGFKGDLDTFISYYKKGLLLYGPYDTHLKEAWSARDHPNLHMLFYEDLKSDIIKEIKRLDAFIGTGLSDQQMFNVQKTTTFDNMKANNEVKMKDFQPTDGKSKGFFRKGQVGSWKEQMSAEQDAVLNTWISEKITPLGVDFRYQ